MRDLPALLARIPDDFKPVVAIGIGAFVLVFLVLLHGSGLHGILVFRARRERRLRIGRPHVVAALFLFGASVFLMLALHIVEFVIWAFVLIWMGLIAHTSDALYFCANAYTTLGYGNVDVGLHWRNIAPIMGISGLFTFAWTTSALVSVVSAHRQLIEQLLEEREKEMQIRAALRRDELDARQWERGYERLETDRARSESAGASVFGRIRIWKAERKRLGELHKAESAKIDELRRKERDDEEKLGSAAPAQNPADRK